MADLAAPNSMPEPGPAQASVGTPPAGLALGGVHELTAQWLTTALASRLGGAKVTAVDVEPIGTGQVSDSVRLSLTYDRPVDLPATLVAKVPSASEASRTAAAMATRHATHALDLGSEDLLP